MAKYNATDDSPDKTTVKADLYSIIKRRRRTVEAYLAENDVTTPNQMANFLELLKETFSLSTEFMEEYDAIDMSKPAVNIPPVVVVHEVDIPKPTTKSKKKTSTPKPREAIIEESD